MIEIVLGFVLLAVLMSTAYSTTYFILGGYKHIPLLRRTIDAEKRGIALIVVAAFIYDYLGGWDVISILLVLIAVSISLKHLAAYYHRHRGWQTTNVWRRRRWRS